MLFIVICAVVIVVSVFTKPASDAQLAGLTYGSISAEQRAEIKAGIDKWDIIHTAIILIITIAIYSYFW